MSKIISLNDKLKLSEREKASTERKRKLLAVRQVFQCSHCTSKCERCGIGLGPVKHPQTEYTRIPYNFCDSCAEEYIDYIDHLQGKGQPEAYWHNHAWRRTWQTWIEYQGTIDQYMRSKEFLKLIEELRPHADGDK